MITKGVVLGLLAACLSCTSALAQDDTARERLILARAQYYTPTRNGLKSFRCGLSLNWKELLTRITRAEVPDDNAFLNYLQGVQLSIVDELEGQGAMEWMDTSAPPAGLEGNAQQIRGGLQIMMAGFFQSWNGFMNGGMVPFPDQDTTLTTAGDGFHLNTTSPNVKVDEDFDKNMLLTLATVETPQIKISAVPTYTKTDDGLIISSVTSKVNQPPSAPEVDIAFRIGYARVGSFQLPWHILYDVKNVGPIEVGFTGCRTTASDSAQ